DDDVRPEAGAVLAHPPPFVLPPPLCRGYLQPPLRFARLHVLWWIKPGNVLSENLLGRVPLDALGPGVPAHHPPCGIEHEQRILLHALHQQPEPLLRLAQGLFRPVSPGQVARDFREAEQRAVGAPQGRDHDVRPEAGAVLRSEEHTSELQSRFDLVCRLLLEKKNKTISYT